MVLGRRFFLGVAADEPVFVLSGPNRDLFGQRQPGLYGRATLEDVERLCRETGQRLRLGIECRRTHAEGTPVDHVHEGRTGASAIVINPAAYAHTSVALQDALHAREIPVIDVHVTNTARREACRHTDDTAQVATARINGCGVDGCRPALEHVHHLLRKA